MANKQELPAHIQNIVTEYESQIAFYKENNKFLEKQLKINKASIEALELAKKAYLEFQPFQVTPSQINAPLSRDMIREFLRNNPNAIRTVEIIDLIYPTKTDEEKGKLVKSLSVMLNLLEKEGAIEIIKQKGTKGNYYRWIKK